jgi:DNA-directed RNA polymerase specialized sigma24 family protein
MVNDVQEWLARLRSGNNAASQELWQAYIGKLMRLAERRLGSLPRRVVDQEDVALSAMNSFIQGARAGRFPLLADESDLWRLLVTITSRKAHAARRHHFAARRNYGRTRGESALAPRSDVDGTGGIESIAGRVPTPAFAAQVAEEFQRLFERLDDPILQNIARWKMEGFSNEEIAARMGRNVRTVERKLSLIRDCWLNDHS